MNQPLAEFTDYETLRKALNACRDHRDLSYERMDEITGAPSGYFAKLLGPRALKRIGLQSLGWALGGLGIKAVLVSDPEALAKIESRFTARDVPHLKSVMHAGSLQVVLSGRHMSIIQRKGGRASWAKLTPKQRTARARKMAKARWKKTKQRARQRKASHKARAIRSTRDPQ